MRLVHRSPGLRFRTTFLALVSAQALHSLEEYAFHLYDVFPTARFVSGLVSPDLGRGFLIVNAALIVFGFCCYWWPVRRGWPSAVPIAWFWVGIEVVNGVGHPAWSLLSWGYRPGALTALLLLLPLALLLARQLIGHVNRRSLRGVKP